MWQNKKTTEKLISLQHHKHLFSETPSSHEWIVILVADFQWNQLIRGSPKSAAGLKTMTKFLSCQNLNCSFEEITIIWLSPLQCSSNNEVIMFSFRAHVCEWHKQCTLLCRVLCLRHAAANLQCHVISQPPFSSQQPQQLALLPTSCSSCRSPAVCPLCLMSCPDWSLRYILSRGPLCGSAPQSTSQMAES